MENGEGGYRAMLKCLVEANALPAEIDMINCHATSTEVGDLAELNAIKNLFGNKKLNEKSKLVESFENFEIENIEINSDYFDRLNLKKIILSANKTFIGHLLGAAGSVEAIFSKNIFYWQKHKLIIVKKAIRKILYSSLIRSVVLNIEI